LFGQLITTTYDVLFYIKTETRDPRPRWILAFTDM